MGREGRTFESCRPDQYSFSKTPLFFLDSRVDMNYSVEVEQETDGRWLAEVPELPGVLAYGVTVDEAIVRAETLALRVMADRLEQGEAKA